MYQTTLLILEALLIMLFSVDDLLSFYIFFESVLPPLFIIVGTWGAEGRVRAAFLLFLYTLAGSLPRLLAILHLGSIAGSYNFSVLASLDLTLDAQIWPWLAIFIALAVKTPFAPFTLWLTRAHARAPVGASRLLAAIILKLAVYGFIRIRLPILPEACEYFTPLVLTISLVTLLYSCGAIMRQTDIKVLVAYSSICHRAVGVAGLFSNNLDGLKGAIRVALAHGFVSPALFYIVGGVRYDRFHTREIRYYRGLTNYRPLARTFFFLFAMANAATPLTANWVGEFLTLAGTFQRAPLITIGLSSSIVFGAAYSYWLFSRVAFGAYSPSLQWTTDVSRREAFVLLSLLLPTFVLGLYPNLAFDFRVAPLQALLHS